MRGRVMYRVEIFRDKSGDWRWRVRARNSKIVADSSEGYRKRSHTEAMARKLFPDFEIVEVS